MKVAIDIFQVPSRIGPVRNAPLPPDVAEVLQIAASDADALARAVARTGRPAEFLKPAAAFFVEQILLAPGTDSYRVLGATPRTSVGELRQHMALLMRWLHPDAAGPEARAVFAARVTAAWENLKTETRREAYGREAAHRTDGAGESEPAAGRSTRSNRKGGEGARNGSQNGSQRRPAGAMRAGGTHSLGIKARLANWLFGARR